MNLPKEVMQPKANLRGHPCISIHSLLRSEAITPKTSPPSSVRVRLPILLACILEYPATNQASVVSDPILRRPPKISLECFVTGFADYLCVGWANVHGESAVEHIAS